MKTDNIIADRSLDFAVRIVRLYKYLREEKQEFVLSKQLLRSGTSIGANVQEALRGQSRKDFVSKMNIALKEVAETEYWLELLCRTDYINKVEFDSVFKDCKEIAKILMSIVKTTNTSE